MHCYLMHICLLASFQAYYFPPSNVCDHKIDPVNGISAYKLVEITILNEHYLLHFISEMIFIYVVTVPRPNPDRGQLGHSDHSYHIDHTLTLRSWTL